MFIWPVLCGARCCLPFGRMRVACRGVVCVLLAVGRMCVACCMIVCVSRAL